MLRGSKMNRVKRNKIQLFKTRYTGSNSAKNSRYLSDTLEYQYLTVT